MSTKTISLSDEAYKRLKALKREGESFSDTIRRLTAGQDLSRFHGVLSEETADDIEYAIRSGREAHRKHDDERLKRLWDDDS